MTFQDIVDNLNILFAVGTVRTILTLLAVLLAGGGVVAWIRGR